VAFALLFFSLSPSFLSSPPLLSSLLLFLPFSYFSPSHSLTPFFLFLVFLLSSASVLRSYFCPFITYPPSVFFQLCCTSLNLPPSFFPPFLPPFPLSSLSPLPFLVLSWLLSRETSSLRLHAPPSSSLSFAPKGHHGFLLFVLIPLISQPPTSLYFKHLHFSSSPLFSFCPTYLLASPTLTLFF